MERVFFSLNSTLPYLLRFQDPGQRGLLRKQILHKRHLLRVSLQSPIIPFPGRMDQETERPGFKNRLQCVVAMCPWAYPLAASIYPSVKWADDPCLGQSSRRAGRNEEEDGGKMQGGVPALCTQEEGAMKGPRGKYQRGGCGREVGHLRPMAESGGKQGPRDTDVTCRERPTYSPCRRKEPRVKSPEGTAHGKVRGHVGPH